MGRLLRVFTPFTILLVGLLVLNYKIEDLAFFQRTAVPGTPGQIDQPSERVTDPPVTTNSNPQTIATAIANATVHPTAIPQATAEPTPTLLPKDMVSLTGPPAGSQFSLSTPLTFYWFADLQLSEGESFGLFFANDSGETLVGTVSEPNMGNAYQTNLIPETSGFSPGEYFWQVKIIEQKEGFILGESDRRSITLIGSEK